MLKQSWIVKRQKVGCSKNWLTCIETMQNAFGPIIGRIYQPRIGDRANGATVCNNGISSKQDCSTISKGQDMDTRYPIQVISDEVLLVIYQLERREENPEVCQATNVCFCESIDVTLSCCPLSQWQPCPQLHLHWVWWENPRWKPGCLSHQLKGFPIDFPITWDTCLFLPGFCDWKMDQFSGPLPLSADLRAGADLRQSEEIHTTHCWCR